MKKLTLLVLGLALIALPSCFNQGGESESDVDTAQMSQEEKLLTEQLKFNMKNLVESAKLLKAAPFITEKKSGEYALSDKEKMVKPDYLYDFSTVGKLTNLSQKYRAVAVLGVDKVLAELYDMPVTGFKASIAKLIVDINDPALTQFSKSVWDNDGNVNEAISALVDGEYEAQRANYFWEFVAAGLVEEVYILTENMDKFLPLFDDQAAADITFNFVCVHYGLTEMIKLYPEMSSLDEVLVPLYVINATSVDELKTQLLELKDSIKRIRTNLL